MAVLDDACFGVGHVTDQVRSSICPQPASHTVLLSAMTDSCLSVCLQLFLEAMDKQLGGHKHYSSRGVGLSAITSHLLTPSSPLLADLHRSHSLSLPLSLSPSLSLSLSLPLFFPPSISLALSLALSLSLYLSISCLLSLSALFCRRDRNLPIVFGLSCSLVHSMV